MAKNEMASKTESLIRSIERALKQVSEQLDVIINSHIELLKRQKFWGSELPIIEKIESFDIKVKTVRIDEITSKVQDAYSIELISYKKIVQNGISPKIIETKIGKFIYGEVAHDDKMIKRGPVEMENGAIYTGE